MENGLLTITFPESSPELAPKKITISFAGNMDLSNADSIQNESIQWSFTHAASEIEPVESSISNFCKVKYYLASSSDLSNTCNAVLYAWHEHATTLRRRNSRRGATRLSLSLLNLAVRQLTELAEDVVAWLIYAGIGLIYIMISRLIRPPQGLHYSTTTGETVRTLTGIPMTDVESLKAFHDKFTPPPSPEPSLAPPPPYSLLPSPDERASSYGIIGSIQRRRSLKKTRYFLCEAFSYIPFLFMVAALGTLVGTLAMYDQTNTSLQFKHTHWASTYHPISTTTPLSLYIYQAYWKRNSTIKSPSQLHQ
ncbi:hypothetical protein CPC08DRAFT_754590 [Agrocybe pediades]|nr:hypothetical protein CPC08DRAFT_754590 [Agrocybe pediades]